MLIFLLYFLLLLGLIVLTFFGAISRLYFTEKLTVRYFYNVEDLGHLLRLELLDALGHQLLVRDDAAHVIELLLGVCKGIVAAFLSKVDHMSDVAMLIFGSFRL